MTHTLPDYVLLVAKCQGALEAVYATMPYLNTVKDIADECATWLANYYTQARLDDEAEYADEIAEDRAGRLSANERMDEAEARGDVHS